MTQPAPLREAYDEDEDGSWMADDYEDPDSDEIFQDDSGDEWIHDPDMGAR